MSWARRWYRLLLVLLLARLGIGLAVQDVAVPAWVPWAGGLGGGLGLGVDAATYR